MTSFENQYAFYVRDRWRRGTKLTLDLGLRWELYPNRTREDGLGIESYDPDDQRGADWRTRGHSSRQRRGITARSSSLPALGFAYQLNDATVIRGGYGITYNPHPWGAQALRGWYPLTVVATFDGVNGYQPVTTSPGYVSAGVPNAPLGPDCRNSIDLLPRHQHGQGSAARRGRDRIPRANEMLHRGYIQSWNLIVERTLPFEIRRIGGLCRVGGASGDSRSSISTPRRFPAPGTKGGRCSRSSDAQRRPGNLMAVRTATTIRCRRR